MAVIQILLFLKLYVITKCTFPLEHIHEKNFKVKTSNKFIFAYTIYHDINSDSG